MGNAVTVFGWAVEQLLGRGDGAGREVLGRAMLKGG
jgi:hypothetical protein